MTTAKRRARLPVAVFLAASGLVLAAQHRTLYKQFEDPTGVYVAQVTYHTVYSLMPMMPGSSSDKPGFVEIFRKGGDSQGRIPVPMLQMATIDWEREGASIKLVGEWNFAQGSCFYWNEAENRRIYIKGRE